MNSVGLSGDADRHSFGGKLWRSMPLGFDSGSNVTRVGAAT